MQVILAAMGGGAPGTMTAECAGALAAAECVVGARRLLAALPAGCTARRVEAARPQEVLQAVLEARGYASLCVVAYSGDTGFYSGACGLLPLLAENGVAARVLPGISSVQLLAARLGRPWQDWTLVSAHGAACDAAAAVCGGRPVFFLTGGTLGPAALCAQLCEAGLGGLAVTVGENLSYPDERVTRLLGRGRGHGQRERGAGFGRALRPRVRGGVRSRRLRAHPPEPGAVRGVEYDAGAGPRPGGAGRAARAGCCFHRRHRGRHGRRGGRGAGAQPVRADLHFRNCAGDAFRRRCGADGPRAGRAGDADRRQPHPARGRAAPAYGEQSCFCGMWPARWTCRCCWCCAPGARA